MTTGLTTLLFIPAGAMAMVSGPSESLSVPAAPWAEAERSGIGTDLPTIVSGIVLVMLALACIFLARARELDRKEVEKGRVRQQREHRVRVHAQRARIAGAIEVSSGAGRRAFLDTDIGLDQLVRVAQEGTDRCVERLDGHVLQEQGREHQVRRRLETAITDLHMTGRANLRFMLESVGLRSALDHLRGTVQLSRGSQVTMEFVEPPRPLGTNQALTAYKLVFDAVQAMLGMTGVDRLAIKLEGGPDELRLMAESNGAWGAYRSHENDGMSRLAFSVARLKGSLKQIHQLRGGGGFSITIPWAMEGRG